MKVTFKSGQAATYVFQDYNGGALERLEGSVTGTANALYYLHIFDLSAVPANATAPKRSLQVLGQDGFRFDFTTGDLEFKVGMCFALSSTEETYTAVVDGAKVDWEGEVDTQATQGLTIVGDMTTGVNSLSAWPTATGPKYLMEVDWTNAQAAVAFLLFFTKNAPSNGDVPDVIIGSSDSSLANVTKNYRFGKSGIAPLAQVTLNKGGVFKVSSTANVLTLGTAVDNIRIKYRTSL